MDLPSKYAPEGLSKEDQSKVIRVGSFKKRGSHYTLRRTGSISDENHIGIENNISHEKDKKKDINMDIDDVNYVNKVVNIRRDSTSADMYEIRDIDMIDMSESSQIESSFEGISILIIDTNFILSHLDIIQDLAKNATLYKILFIIPVTVIGELDGLKNSNKISDDESVKSALSVGQLARTANDWLYACFAENSPYVIGQKMYQRKDTSARKDDAILDCCLYFQEKNRSSLVILLSNDKNLCIKALTNDVLTVSFREGMTAALIGETIRKENHSRVNETKSNQPDLQETNFQSSGEIHALSNPLHSFIECSHIIYNEIKTLVVSVTKHCMKNTFGSELELLRGYHPRSILDLSDCLLLISEYWLAVFAPILRSIKNKVFYKMPSKRLNLAYTEVPLDVKELEDFVNYWSEVLHLMYISEMDETQNTSLNTLIDRWNSMVQNLHH